MRPPRAPTDCIRRYGLRPSTVGAQSGAEAHRRRAHAMPRPRSGAPPGALERPPVEPGARVASGHLQPPGAGSGGPERATAAAQPAPPPASCSSAPQQHGRLARSEATRRRHSAQAAQASRRSSCTCGGSRWELGEAATGPVRTGRRAGKGCAGTGGSAGSPFEHACSRLCKAGAASSATTQHARSHLLPTRRSCPRGPCCASQRRRRQRRRSR